MSITRSIQRALRVSAFLVCLSIVVQASAIAPRSGRDPRFAERISVHDLARYGDMMTLSREQWYVFSRAYIEYLKRWSELAPEIEQRISQYANAPTIKEMKDNLVEHARINDALRARIDNVDMELFASIEPLLATDQLPGLTRAKDHRVRQTHDVRHFMSRHGGPFADLSESVELANLDLVDMDVVKVVMIDYEHRLALLMSDLHDEAHDAYVRFLSKVNERGVTNANGPREEFDAIAQSVWPEIAARAIRLAKQIDDLNRSTIKRLESSLTTAGLQLFRDQYLRVLYPEAAELFQARNRVSRAVLTLEGLDDNQKVAAAVLLEAANDELNEVIAAMTVVEDEMRLAHTHDPRGSTLPFEREELLKPMRERFATARKTLFSSLEQTFGSSTGEYVTQYYSGQIYDRDERMVRAFRGDRIARPTLVAQVMMPKKWWNALVSCLQCTDETMTALAACWVKYADDANAAQLDSKPDGFVDDVIVERLNNAMFDRALAALTDGQMRVVLELAREAQTRLRFWCDRAGGAARCDPFNLLLNAGATIDDVVVVQEMLRTYHRKAIITRQSWSASSIARAALEESDWRTWGDRKTLQGEAIIAEMAQLNCDIVSQLLSLVRPELRARLRQVYWDTCFDELADPRVADSVFDVCLALEDASNDQRATIIQLYAEYRSAYDSLTDGLVSALRNNIRWIRDRDGATVPLQNKARDDVARLRFQRNELNELARLQLATLLSEDQFAIVAPMLEIAP